jgi:histidyl-tRNA synthetase
MSLKHKAPRGTQDILPQTSWRWQRLEAAFRDACRRFGYQEIRTPTFEETELFTRGVGEGTELVSKQMYTFEDKGGRSLTLRAEGTAPVVRAYLEHALGAAGGVQKLYYITPIFRYERPQAGRLRQHHQLGIEAIGSPGPEIDAEVIALFHDLMANIGVEGGVTHLSSIGDAACRPAFQQALRAFFKPVLAEMCGFCQARYETNPMRMLDCKVPHDVELRAGAPSALDFLCDECAQHFAGVRRVLDTLDVQYEVDPTIVRGLDYYTRTAFEVVHSGLGAKDVLMGGGRYDGLAEMLGGPPTPGIGFGSGIERMLMVLDATGAAEVQPAPVEVYVAAAGDEARLPALRLAADLRSAGIGADVDFTSRSLKAQMREASRLGARLTALIGEDEIRAHQVTLRDMQTGEQETISRDDVVRLLAARYAAGKDRE